MDGRTFALIFLGAAAIAFAYATLGRLLGFHKSFPWTGGGTSTLTGELAVAGFFGCLGFAVLFSPAFFLPALVCWLVGSRSQTNANRRFAQQEEELRKTNAQNHPGIFDTDPPTELDPTLFDMVDLYDCGSCVYLGRLDSSIVSRLIAATSEIPDQGPNDIFVIEETLEPPVMPDAIELKALLRDHFDARGYAILRWFPAQSSK